MELKGIERVRVTDIVPQKGNILEQKIVKDIIEKAGLSVEELIQAEFTTTQEGIQFNTKKLGELSKEIDFTKIEIDLMKKQIGVLEKEKKVDQFNLSLCIKITESK